MSRIDSRDKLIAEEAKKLPQQYQDSFSEGFIMLLVALHLHGLTILRADEAKATVDEGDNLQEQLDRPSVWLQSSQAGELTDKLSETKPGTDERLECTNKLIRANLAEQKRLLDLLDKFYESHTPASARSHLIIETTQQGESYLRPQGASSRIVLAKHADQKPWLEEFQAEMLAFAEFLVSKL